jgi:hypothetical protein
MKRTATGCSANSGPIASTQRPTLDKPTGLPPVALLAHKSAVHRPWLGRGFAPALPIPPVPEVSGSRFEQRHRQKDAASVGSEMEIFEPPQAEPLEN